MCRGKMVFIGLIQHHVIKLVAEYGGNLLKEGVLKREEFKGGESILNS